VCITNIHRAGAKQTVDASCCFIIMIHELQSHADNTAAAAAVTAAANDESTKWLICIAGVGGRSVS